MPDIFLKMFALDTFQLPFFFFPKIEFDLFLKELTISLLFLFFFSNHLLQLFDLGIIIPHFVFLVFIVNKHLLFKFFKLFPDIFQLLLFIHDTFLLIIDDIFGLVHMQSVRINKSISMIRLDSSS